MPAPTPTPSSATHGFFQATPIVRPAYTSTPVAASDDPILPRIISLYLPQPTPRHIDNHLHHLSRLALHPATLEHCTLADNNPPTLSQYTTFGAPNQSPSQLRTSPSWQYLKALQTSQGIIASGYPSEDTTHNPRIYQFLLSHIFDPSSALVSCPAAMTDGAAKLLSAQLESESSIAAHSETNTKSFNDRLDRVRHQVFQEAYHRLTSSSPDYAWTAGQWMTERSGGSDVSGTETIATLLTGPQITDAAAEVDAAGLPLGPWSVSGFKWFSSAIDANCAILLAKTPSRPNGELSCFFAPLHRRPTDGRRRTNATTTTTPGSLSMSSFSSTNTQKASPSLRRAASPNVPKPPRSITHSRHNIPLQMNGIQLHRLKRKLGTRALPTAELQLTSTRAWLIGSEGQGIKAISAVLNVTRLHTAKGAIAGWGRGLAVARAWTRVRNVKAVTYAAADSRSAERESGGKLKATTKKMPLAENHQHVRWMAQETVRYRAHAALCYFGVALLGVSESMHLLNDSHSSNSKATMNTTTTTRAQQIGLIPPTKPQVEAILRIITPLAKSSCSLAAVHGLRECMECLGGVGYCENDDDAVAGSVVAPAIAEEISSAIPLDEDEDANDHDHARANPQPGVLNIARLFRDAAVNPIWEGTRSVLAEDLLRALGVGSRAHTHTHTRGRTNKAHQEQGQTKVLEQVIYPWLRTVLSSTALKSRSGSGKGSGNDNTGLFAQETQMVWKLYDKVKDMLAERCEEELLWQGRMVVKMLTDLFCAVLLMADAAGGGGNDDDDEEEEDAVAVAVARRWVRIATTTDDQLGQGQGQGQGHGQSQNWREEAEMDRRIFLGEAKIAPRMASKL